MLILTRGLPGSGKTTWATAYVLDHPAGTVVRVNRDSLREMLHAGRFKGQKTESIVTSLQLKMVSEMLASGVDVIVDDTNLNPSTVEKLSQVAKYAGVDMEIKDFTDVPVDECIARDLKRPNSVGAKVIRRMYRAYLAEQVKYEADPSLPHVVLCDVDGTLALMDGRSPYDFSKVLHDSPNAPIVALAKMFSHSSKLVFMSGRDGSCMDDTRAWIAKHLGINGEIELYMRSAGDTRKDSIVKKELFDANIDGRYYVDYVLDDRNSVVEMWRSLGLTVLQVAEGDF